MSGDLSYDMKPVKDTKLMKKSTAFFGKPSRPEKLVAQKGGLSFVSFVSFTGFVS